MAVISRSDVGDSTVAAIMGPGFLVRFFSRLSVRIVS